MAGPRRSRSIVAVESRGDRLICVALRLCLKVVLMWQGCFGLRGLLPACTSTPRGCCPEPARRAPRRAVARRRVFKPSSGRGRPVGPEQVEVPPPSRDQHETSSSHRDRDRVPRITATDDSAYDSARPPLSLRGCPQPLTLAVPAVPDLATCIFREMQGQGGMPGREDAAVRDQRRHESR